MSNDNHIERHKRILNIISHLGLNKQNASFQSSKRQGYLNLESYFINYNNVKKEEQDKLIVKAKELLSKPVKREHIRSESKLVQKIPENMICSNKMLTKAVLVKLQEQQILGQFHEVKNNLRMSKTCYPQPITFPQQKIQIQNMFEKNVVSITLNHLRTTQQDNDFLYKTRESFKDFQSDISHYQNLKQHHRLYKQ
ncbi:unnamed protein product [Paramecium octaurelia]|uniref:Uncharacterized protein n=1 Tax=Paramecium octaurelia TaxID=43137 RepID=A0A8S1VBQ7_PAROT|nr:unnamed protein product [Paramecium octaurelia]